MSLPPRNQRPAAVSISRRQLKSGTKHTLRITDPVTNERIGFGDFDERWQAEQRAVQAFADYEAGLGLKPDPDEAPSSITFRVFVDDVYLPSLDVTTTTMSDYEVVCRHLKKYKEFGDEPLNSITNGKIRTFLAAFRTAPNGSRRSNNYVRKVAQRIRHIFTVAAADGYISATEHPYRYDGSKLNKLPDRPLLDNDCLLTHEAINDMLAILKREGQQDSEWGREAEFWYFLIETAMWSGLRISELMGLQFNDFITATCELRVDAQWAWKCKSDTRFVSPKSKHSKRKVPIPESVFVELWTWAVKVQKEGSPDELVFPRPVSDGSWGYWGSPSHFNLKLGQMQAKVWAIHEKELADKPWLAPYSKSDMVQNFHELRHLWASICICELNFNVLSVSKWAGHFSPAFTAEVYAGLIRKVHDEAANQMRNAGKPTQTNVV